MSARNSPTAKNPRPFVKWAGGKGQLLNELTKRLPKAGKYRCRNYFEIFGGGGALFFSLDKSEICHRLHLSDSNKELINVYCVIRDDVESLIKSLAKHKLSKKYFEEIRAWDRSPRFLTRTELSRASRFIYLNKTAYNGLFRVNSKGHFNAPYGKYAKPNFLDAENLRACSTFLKDVKIEASDFSQTLDQVAEFDFVYMDPPYAPLSPTASFTSYTENGFGKEDQKKLKDFCVRLHERGAFFMLSNSSASWVVNLYRKDTPFRIEKVPARRAISCKSEGRGPVKEIIVRNYR